MTAVFGAGLLPGVNFKREYEALNGQERSDDEGHFLQTIHIPTVNPVVKVSAEEARQLEDGILVFAFPTCPYCRNLMPILTQAAKEGQIPLYYCQIDTYRDIYTFNEQTQSPKLVREAGPGYPELLQWLDGYLPEYFVGDGAGGTVSVGEKRIGAPTLVTVRDGMPVSAWKLADVEGLELPEDKYQLWEEELQTKVKTSLADFLD